MIVDGLVRLRAFQLLIEAQRKHAERKGPFYLKGKQQNDNRTWTSKRRR